VGVLTCVTGVSGSGKSTLINDTLYSLVARDLNRSQVVPAPSVIPMSVQTNHE
jgi:excinuclease ABC subunit A